MKYGIAFKIGALATALVIMTASAVGVMLFYQSENILAEHELTDLKDDAYNTALRLKQKIATLREDSLLLARSPEVRAIVRALQEESKGKAAIDPVSKKTEVQLRQALADYFKKAMGGKPYLQIRLIGKKNKGLEIVRVDRDKNGTLQTVSDDLLQQKETQPYFAEPRKAVLAYFEQKRQKKEPKSGDKPKNGKGDRDENLDQPKVYLSEINLNREGKKRNIEVKQGKIVFPVLRAAVPIMTEQEEFFGVVVINLNFRKLAEKLQPSRLQYYLTDDKGHFLVHPDEQKEFVFDKYKSEMLRKKYPDMREKCVLWEQEGFQQEELDEITLSYPKNPNSKKFVQDDIDDKRRLERRGLSIDGWDRKFFSPKKGLSLKGEQLVGGDQVFMLIMSVTNGGFDKDKEILNGGSDEDKEILKVDSLNAILKDLRNNESLSIPYYREVQKDTSVVRLRGTNKAELEKIGKFLQRGFLLRMSVDQGLNKDRVDDLKEKLSYLKKTGSTLVYTSNVHENVEEVRVGGMSEEDLEMVAADLEKSFHDLHKKSENGIETLGGVLEMDEVISLNTFALQFRRIYFDPNKPNRYLGLIVAASYEEFLAEGRDAAWFAVWIVFALIAIGGALAFVFSQYLTRPLKKITRATRKIADGNFDVSLPVVTQGEIGVLAQSFAKMVQQIQERKKALEEAKAHLENRVRERTLELEHANADLKVTRDKALGANRAKSTFLANMSHELRTPLNAIIGFSEDMKEEAQEAGREDFVKDLDTIIGAGKHQLALINEILDLAKIEAGRMDLVTEQFDIPLLVRDLGVFVDILVKKNGNELVIECPSDIGRMEGDQIRIRQILVNILSNACKFTENGKISMTVSKDRRNDRDMIVFAIGDTGIGITKDQLQNLFQPFQQADTTTSRKYGGTGLGLAISERFCRMMGGHIHVESELRKGSTFTVSLPVEAESVHDSKVFSLEKPLGSSHFSFTLDKPESEPHARVDGNHRQILVIDDDAAVCELMQRFLGKAGFEVTTSFSGEEGLRLAKELRPSAITLDAVMPGMDGWETLVRLKGDPSTHDIPVIMVTMVDDRTRGFSLGASEYVNKPIDWSRLIDILDRASEDDFKKRIMIVENDLEFRKTLEEMLTSKGWDVFLCDTGEDAERYLQECDPALILLNLAMPKVHGIEFLTRLRTNENWRKIPVVAITGVNPLTQFSSEQKKRIQESVQQVFLKNAYDREELLQELSMRISALIEKRSHQTG